MKRLFFLVAIVSLALPTFSCKSKKEATGSSASSATSSEMKKETYRLIVSFISKGAGTDSELRPKFLSYVEQHPKKPKFEMIKWGREGEGDYCFTLSELNSKEQKEFVTEIKTMMGKSDMVHIAENSERLHNAR